MRQEQSVHFMLCGALPGQERPPQHYGLRRKQKRRGVVRCADADMVADAQNLSMILWDTKDKNLGATASTMNVLIWQARKLAANDDVVAWTLLISAMAMTEGTDAEILSVLCSCCPDTHRVHPRQPASAYSSVEKKTIEFEFD